MKKFYRGYVKIGEKHYTTSLAKTESEIVEFIESFCYYNGISNYYIGEVLL